MQSSILLASKLSLVSALGVVKGGGRRKTGDEAMKSDHIWPKTKQETMIMKSDHNNNDMSE